MSLFADSTLYAHFENSLVLDKGSGDPSFTRATTKKVFTYNDVLVDVPIGAVAFPKGRLVVNMLSLGSSEDIDSAGWGYVGCTATTNTFTQSTGTNYCSIRPDRNESFTVNRTYLIQYRVEYVDWQYVGITPAGAVSASNDYANFDIVNGIVNNLGAAEGFIRHVSGNIYDISLRFVCDASGADAGLLYQAQSLAYTKFTTFALDNSSSVNVYKYITTDISYDPTIEFVDFVSKGVESAPYHGAGADGAQWFDTEASGTAIPNETMRGVLIEPAATNEVLYCRDATNAAWSKTNITAALDQTGIDNVSNTASSLLSTAGNGTCFQTLTLAATTRTFSVYVKRITGTGTIEITRDGGSTYTDITSDINSSTYTRVYIRATSQLNPQVGFRIVTSGDKIAFDYAQDESGSVETTPILTTTVATTRNADVLTYQTSGNFNDTNGAIYASVVSDDWATISGNIGSASTGLAASSSNRGVQALDGTNTANGPSGTPVGRMGLAIGWSGSTLRTAAENEAGSSGSYDGSFNLSNIAVGIYGFIKYLNIWTTALTQGQLDDISQGIETSVNVLPVKMLSENMSGHPKDWSNTSITCSVADGATQQNSGALLLYDGVVGNFRQVLNDGGPKTLVDGDEFLYSFSIKTVDQQWTVIRFLDGSTNVLRFWLDIQNNEISNLTTDSTIVEDSSVVISESTSNNEWITCYIWFKVKAATTLNLFHYFADSAGSFNATASAGNSYYLSEIVAGVLDSSNKGQINDAKIAFWTGKGYTGTYNDMQRQWLIELYSSGGFSLSSTNPDLLYRYNKIINRI